MRVSRCAYDGFVVLHLVIDYALKFFILVYYADPHKPVA